ncbi:MAG: hypothetical protein U5R06_18620 [candidate division KSB1 bacterium]|nr:hypothetical protein [candidate division KSB1 bacterium]
MDKDLEAVHRKLDMIAEQLNETRRRQQEMDDLRRDLTPIATDLFNTAAEELDKVSPYFSYEDLIYLGTKLLRNIRNLTSLFERMESAVDFVNDAGPLSKQVFDSTLESLDQMEKRGYFTFFSTVLQTLDTIISNMSEEDMQQMTETLPKFADAFLQLSKTSFADDLNAVAAAYREKPEMPEHVSLFKIMKTASDPKVRQLLYMGLSFVKTISIQMQQSDGTQNMSELQIQQGG